MTATIDITDTGADAFAERVFEASLGFVDVMSITLGDQLGWYDALAERGALTAGALAEATGSDSRYALEWLEQQATTGILTVDDPARPAAERRYTLPDGHREVLTDRDSVAFLAPLARLFAGTGVQLPALLDAYRTGGGVSWAQYGPLVRTGQAEMNRPFFVSELPTQWFPAVPEVHARLQAGALVADVGCGEGWSAIGMALAYPQVRVDAFDIDEPSIVAARAHAEAAGVADRVRFVCTDLAALDGSQAGAYDVVTAFECVHDVPAPVPFLQAMRRLVADDGHVIVMDERVAEQCSGRPDDVERLMYGFSVLLCLPDGRSHAPSAATGTVMRPGTLLEHARAAGFADLEVLPIDNDLWRFYRLTTG